MDRNEVASLYAQTTSFVRKLERARRTVEVAFEQIRSMDYPGYVAFSGGKDSTVVYALARELEPDIPAVWSDDEWWLPETMEYIQRLQSADYDVRQIRTNAVHASWFTVAGQWDGIPNYARAHGWGLCFLGLRQEESGARRAHLRRFGPLFFAQIDDCWHCNPIHDWTWRDVWAYIVSQELDYNRAYDRLGEIGVPPERQRIGPLAVERVLGYGQLAILKQGWPELYNRFVADHPEAGLYI